MQARSHIANQGYQSTGTSTQAVLNPATGQPIGELELIDGPGLDAALASAAQGFRLWRQQSGYDRTALMLEAVAIIRSRKESIARLTPKGEPKVWTPASSPSP